MAYTTRHVNGDTGVDNSTCLEGSLPCATLAYALEDLQSDTSVLLDDQVLSHSNITTVQGNTTISNITISSSHGSTIINCSEEGGFAFMNVSELTITNVEFHGCGVERNSTCYDHLGRSEPYMVSLYLYNCTDVSLISTTVSDSPGAGVAMLAVTGHVSITDSIFRNNGFEISRNRSYSNETVLIGRLAGGGLKIELPSCPPGANLVNCKGSNDVCPPESSHLPEYSNVVYNIENCTFISNTAEVPNLSDIVYDNFVDATYFTTIGRGGGVSVVIKGISHRIHVAVTLCRFEDNWGLYGAGLFMELWHRPDNVSLTITKSKFTRNQVPYIATQSFGTGGGGLRYGHKYCPEHRHEGNTLLVSGCTFDANEAYWGGGVSLALLPEQKHMQGDAVLFRSSLFIRNVARIGAAINFYSQSHLPPQATLKDMQFLYNTMKYSDGPSYVNGEGVVYITSTTLYVKSTLNVLHNHGNGMSVLYGTIHFLNSSTSLFYDNHAFRGAALALYANSAIILHNGSQLNFTENKADTVGGAIYHAALGNQAIFFLSNCPIQLEDEVTNWNEADVALYFVNNSATQGDRGASIYISSFLPCVQGSIQELNKTFRWSTFHYECDNHMFPDCLDLQVSGNGIIINPDTNANLTLVAFPGELAALPFTVEDELHRNVKVPFEGVITDSTSTYAVHVVNGEYVAVTGPPTKNALLELHSRESQTLNVLVNLNISECPPGFLLEKDHQGIWTCQCFSSKSVTMYGIRCNADSMTSKLEFHYWIGYLMADNNNSNFSVGFQTGYCPPGFCHDHSLTLNGSDHFNSDTLDEVVCGPQNRTGVLCGKCKEGYGVSVLLNKWFQCVPCPNPSAINSFKVAIIWFFTEFVPLNILFVVFIVFNVNILSGWGGVLYGFVFFFQVVLTTPVFQYITPTNNDDVTADDWYGCSLYINKFLSQLWNLMFLSAFIPQEDACVTATATVQSAILIAYLYILVWPLIVYACLIMFHRCYRHGYCCRPAHKCLFRMGKTLAKCQQSEGGGVNSLAGLCSFFVLAYTKLVMLTWGICGQSTILSSNGERRYVFLYNGTVPWFDRDLHAPYAVPILLCSFLCVLIPTLLLVSFPLLPKLFVKLKLHERRPFRWIISILNTSYLLFLYDIFQGCFKPNARYFAALYLIYRHLFIFVWSFMSWVAAAYGVYQSILSVIFVMIHFIAQPFASNVVNRITGLVMTNLTLVIILSQWIILFEQESVNLILIKIVTLILLYLPHFAVAILFTWVIARYIYQQITQRWGSNESTMQVGTGKQLEESGLHGNVADWDSYRCDCTSSSWEESRGNRIATGYVQLEEEEEEDMKGERVNADRMEEQLQIQGQRHTARSSVGRRIYSEYGSLADSRKTQ